MVEEHWDDILKDDTKEAMHLVPTSIPDQAFKYLLMRVNAISKDLAIVSVSIKDQNGNPAKQVLVQNLIGLDGNNLYTDDFGFVNGYAAVGDTTFQISGYGDIADFTFTETLIQGGEYQFEWTVTRRNYLEVLASRNIRFTKDVPTISYTLCGGGGGGCGSITRTTGGHGGGGGGGGYCNEFKNLNVESNKDYQINIGAGGSGGTSTDGGTTTFLGHSSIGGKGATMDSTGAYAKGLGGAGNGKGGDGSVYLSNLNVSISCSNGGSGQNTFYASYTTLKSVGGGGGGGKARYGNGSIGGGSPNGGSGGTYGDSTSSSSYSSPGSGKQIGGGGGGAGGTEHAVGNSGGNGGAGGAGIRMHLSITI